jgi:hypothetical protein
VTEGREEEEGRRSFNRILAITFVDMADTKGRLKAVRANKFRVKKEEENANYYYNFDLNYAQSPRA